MTYPFDPAVRTKVTELLYGLLPELYRIRDLAEGTTEPQGMAAPKGAEELYKFIHVLAAPLAELRQNIDELHANLFIDKCADWVLPYLAQMVGTRLIFPDAASNRKDVRGTVGWRRRKGTPAMLEEMASDLSGHMVVTQEGWKRLLVSQDLNLLRPARTLPRIGPAVLAERAGGPLDATYHAVDPRRIGARTGRYHPKHVAHWIHPTQLFPLREGTALDRTARDVGGTPLDGDLRYAFHPLGEQLPLRVRRAHALDRVLTDRAPAMHFAESPGDYFDQTGTSNARFTVRLNGLPGGVARPEPELRAASPLPASETIAVGPCRVRLLERAGRVVPGRFQVELFAVPLVGANLDTPDTAGAQARARIEIDANTGVEQPVPIVPVASPFVAMLRIRPLDVPAAYFSGATLELAGQTVDARLSAVNSSLAALGFLRGALVVDVPATWVYGDRWLFLAADGSTFDAQSPSAAQSGAAPDLVLVPGDGGALLLPGDALTVGPGPAWPPLPPRASPNKWRNVPCAMGRGPVVLHGGPAVLRTGPTTFTSVGPTVDMGLVFAARVRNRYEPFLRLDWTGPDPTSATTFSVLASDATALTTAGSLAARLGEIATLARDERDAIELEVRFEADVSSVVLPPCEVVFTSDTGDVVLVHLPMLETGAVGPTTWAASLTHVSRNVSVAEDGATYTADSFEVSRYSYGPIAPLRDPATYQRRRVRWRNLCPWNNETLTEKHAPTEAGFLDIDPTHGLFSLAKNEPAAEYTTSIEGLPPPSPVTVDYQEGYSHHVGARPAPREPVLGQQLATPTRLVVGGGRFHRNAPAEWHDLPRYATVSDALSAIQADPNAAPHEVIQIEDSATYLEPDLTWPTNVTSLTIQAAEDERPVLRFDADWRTLPLPDYEAITLRGLVLDQRDFGIDFPKATDVRVELCTATGGRDTWSFTAPDAGQANLRVFRCLTGRVVLDGKALLSLTECTVDAVGGMAIDAPEGEVHLDRVTVVTDLLPTDTGTLVRVLEATETIFTNRVEARDRFHGCIRYSRVEPGSELPRRHRVVSDEPAFVTRDRADPAHLRLSDRCPRAVLRGAEDGSEMGAFHEVRFAQRTDALLRRLIEYTPAGLATGTIRLD